MPWLLAIFFVLASIGMLVRLALKIKTLGFNKTFFNEQSLLALAGLGVLLLLYFTFKLIFQRGVKAPDRNQAETESHNAPVFPAIASELIGISPRVTVAAPEPHRGSDNGSGTGNVESTSGTDRNALKVAPRAASTTPATPVTATTATSPAKTISATATLTKPPPARLKQSSANSQGTSLTTGSLTTALDHTTNVYQVLRRGTVIPAHPLALDSNRRFDEHRMRALTRYYLAAGAGGIAAGVHTTQFEIRQPEYDLFRPVLETVANEIQRHETRLQTNIVKVAGICGDTKQAVAEAELAGELGYNAGLLNLAALPKATDEQLIQHCRAVAKCIPLFGFFLAPSLGGRPLSYNFWHRFCDIENVIAIKIAAFNRYQTQDVIRAVAHSGRALSLNTKNHEHPIAIYTGNDDNIVGDLLGSWTVDVNGSKVTQRIVGGMLGHWSCWTKAAVDTLRTIKRLNRSDELHEAIITVNRQVTDMNAAVFDAANNYKGAVPGVHEVLRRQGLLEGTWCLDPNQTLSPGQADEIDRVARAYPHLTDDDYVAQNKNEWLR